MNRCEDVHLPFFAALSESVFLEISIVRHLNRSPAGSRAWKQRARFVTRLLQPVLMNETPLKLQIRTRFRRFRTAFRHF